MNFPNPKGDTLRSQSICASLCFPTTHFEARGVEAAIESCWRLARARDPPRLAWEERKIGPLNGNEQRAWMPERVAEKVWFAREE